MTGPKRVTEKQLAANRANAQKSTGPRTPEGKARSSWNAMTHGILARAVIPPSLERYEDPADLASLLARLREDYAPATAVEGMLIEVIAACYWRLARLVRAEGGAIARARSTAKADEQKAERLLSDLERDAKIIEEALAKGDHETIRRTLDPYRLDPLLHGDRALREAPLSLAAKRQQQREYQARDPQADQDRASLPDRDETLAFARYESQLHRQLHRALLALERLQRRRQGEAVPPPLAVDVTLTSTPNDGPS